MSLLKELKRRNVFRVAITYMVIAWVVLQVADLVLNNIGAPAWVIQALILIIVLGLFISVAISWIYEITPEGIKKEKDIEHDETIEHITSKKLDILVLIALSFIAIMFAWDKFYPSHQQLTSNTVETSNKSPAQIQNPSVQSSSIAVLPFVNMSADKENEYFSDGLSEELLNLLAKVNKLKVAARTSSFKFKGEKKDIVEIGALLGVAHVLEGSVRKSGSQIRITAQLIKVDDGFHLWSETYDRELNDVFAVQDEIAGAIVEALKLPLLGHDEQPLAGSKVENIAAYDLYLLGKHHFRKHDQPGFEKAIEYFNKAIKEDPQFALAYSGLADSYVYLADFGNKPQKQAVELAQEAAEKALSIDPNNAETHATMGFVFGSLGDIAQQTTHYQEALQLNPNLPNVLDKVVDFYGDNLNFDKAFELSKKALSLDPLSVLTRRRFMNLSITTHQYEPALILIKQMITEDPDDPTPYEVWGDLYLVQGLPHLSIDMYSKSHELRPDDIYMASRNVRAALQLNDIELASYWLEQAKSRGSNAQWTRFAEIDFLYATGEFNKLLEISINQNQQPNHALLLLRRGQLQMLLDQYLEAETSLKQSLIEYSYDKDNDISLSQASVILQYANVLDHNKNRTERELLLNHLNQFVQDHSQSNPKDFTLDLIMAKSSSIQNDIESTLKHLQTSIKKGYRNHWDLLGNPIYQRWQQHPEFIKLHQSMLKTAANMREQYYINNPKLGSSE